MSYEKKIVKVVLKGYNNKRDKSLPDPCVCLPAADDAIYNVLKKADENVLLENVSLSVEWLTEEDSCFRYIFMYEQAAEILFQLNDFCKRLDGFNPVQKQKLYASILANSGIEGPDGIGPWHPDLVYAINLSYTVNEAEFISDVTCSDELGDYVIKNKQLPVLAGLDDEVVKLLSRKKVAEKFVQILDRNGKLRNSVYVEKRNPRFLHGFYFNLPFLKDIPKRYDGDTPQFEPK